MSRLFQPTPDDRELLDRLQRKSFAYFEHEVNPANGLVADKTHPDWPASIAAIGLALTAYPVGVERGYTTRDEALQRTLTTLRFFRDSPHGPQPDAAGHKGFYYHWLDMYTGRRVWNCELSTVDTAILLAGMLVASTYFDRDREAERSVRTLADELYRRVDWQWAQDGGVTLTHGWKPESGFLPYRWHGYDEAILLYVLGLGSPTRPLPPESYAAFTSTYAWKEIDGIEMVYAGPLFIHQLSHLWIDFRGIQDSYMRQRGLDYFENSGRATRAQQRYAIRNPQGYTLYGERCWGITASDGPDDGTLAPWAVAASLPFAPDLVLPTLHYFSTDVDLERAEPYGYKATFNPSFPVESGNPFGWVSPWNYGLNQGPIVLMIENYRADLIWRLLRQNAHVVTGLRRAGFTGGWLD